MTPRRPAPSLARDHLLGLAWRAALALGTALLCLRALGLSPTA